MPDENQNNPPETSIAERRATVPQLTEKKKETSIAISDPPPTPAKEKKLYVEWGPVKSKFILGVGILVSGFMLWHLSDLANIENFEDGKITLKMLLYTGLNLISVMAICTGFGKPYSVAYVTLFGCLALIVCGYKYQGLYEWMERFFWLTGILVLITEYWVNGYRYGREKKQD